MEDEVVLKRLGLARGVAQAEVVRRAVLDGVVVVTAGRAEVLVVGGGATLSAQEVRDLVVVEPM